MAATTAILRRGVGYFHRCGIWRGCRSPAGVAPLSPQRMSPSDPLLPRVPPPSPHHPLGDLARPPLGAEGCSEHRVPHYLPMLPSPAALHPPTHIPPIWRPS